MRELVKRLKEHAIDLDVVNDQLKLSVPENFDSHEVIEEIRQHKQELISFIKSIKGIADYRTIEPAARKPHYVLSAAQRRLYFLFDFDPSSLTYNMPQIMRLKGMLDQNRLKTAFQGLVNRHESFRTRFEMHEDEPVQVIEDQLNFELEVHETTDEQEAAQIAKDFVRPFDLGKASLLRAGVIILSEGEFILLTDMHHIVSDGVSMGILKKEIMSLYNGATLPALRLQYKDYAEWQQGESALEKLTKERAFWLDSFQEMPEALNLPTDYLRPKVRNFAGDAVHFTLSEAETKGLRQMALAQGTTMHILMLSITNVLLARLSNQQDVVVGTPTVGRFHDDLSSIVGMFVNTLPLRNEPSGDKTFSSFLGEVKNNTLACFDHQGYQYEQLINDLQISRDTGRNPLFDVMYVYEGPGENDDSRVAELQSETFEYTRMQTVKFDLSVSISEMKSEMAVSFSYTIDLFAKETIERFTGFFKAITQAILKDVDVPLSAIDVLSKEERSLLLDDFNASAKAYDNDQTVIDLFARQVAERPEATALVFEGQNVSYLELDAKSNQLAHLLVDKGIPKGDLIALLFDRSPEMIISLLGVLKAGAAYLPIDPHYPEKRIEYILNDSNAQFLIIQKRLSLPESGTDYWQYDDTELQGFASSTIDTSVSLDHLAYVIYTSGTTGNPKGTLIEHRCIPRIVSANNYIDIAPEDKVLQLSNYTFDGSVFDIYGALTNGATLVMISPDKAKDVAAISEVIKENKVTVSFITSTLFNLLVTENIETLKSFRKILIGGEALSIPHIQKALKLLGKGKLINGYGPTESTVFAVTHDISELNEQLASIPIGKPVSGSQIYILNPHKQLSPLGVSGELYIAGSGLSQGYLNNDELTEERFVPNPFEAGTLMYKTGDLARWLPDGTIEYLGRVDDQIKLRGFRIELAEIQARLGSHPQVKEAAVLAQGKGSDQYIAGYYVANEEIDRKVLKDFLLESLPDYMVPSYFIWQEEFQLTANGKLNRKALPDPQIEDDGAVIAAANETEEQLVAIWSDVLKLAPESINVTTNFFELGGHSLRATVVVNKIRKALEVKVPLIEFFQHADIRSLAAYILKQEKQGVSSIPKAEEKAHYTLSSAQKRQYFLQQYDLESINYNMPQVLKLRGNLDLDRLQGAFQSLVDRHESFRTRFEMQDDEPVQIIEQDLDFKVEISESKNEQEAKEIVQRFVRPFDLTHASLLRAAIVKVSGEEHILMTDMHHIISDGVSMDILRTEVMSLYSGASLPELRLQYKDYSEWQQGEEAQERLENERKFWLDQYQELPEVLNLPTDHTRPENRTYAGDTVQVSLSESDTAGLKQMAKTHGATMHMLMLSVTNVLLSRLSNQQDIVVGTPTAGRFHDDLAGIVGMFVNSLPLRNTPTGEKTFKAFLEEVKTNTLACFDHQTYQYEELINELQIDRDTGRNPLFDVMYTYHNLEQSEAVAVGELSSESYDSSGSELAKFDLLISAGEEGAQLTVSFNFAIELFDRQTIERFAEYFKNIAKAILDNEDKALSDISIIPETERQLLLHEFNASGAAYCNELTVIDLFNKQVKESPGATALIFGEEQVSYQQLDDASNQVANMLVEKGKGSGDLIALLFERSIEMIVSILGVLKSGAAYLPIDPKYPEKRIDYILNDSGTGLLLCQNGLSLAVSLSEDLEQWTYQKSTLDLFPTDLEPISISLDDLAYVIYTSGTTGKPKGTLIEHRCIPRVVWQSNYLDIEPSDKVLQLSNYAFDGSVFDIYGALANGASLVLIKPEKAGDITAISKLIKEEEVTVTFITTALFNLLVAESVDGLLSLRKILFGGELVSLTHSREALKTLGTDRLIHVYGPTESTVFATAYDINDIEENATTIPIGGPISGTQAYILDANQNLVPLGVSGELYIAGSGLSRGYLNNEDLTEERFVTNPFVEGGRLYKTGDLARWLPNGAIEFQGRVDDQIKLRGFRIELAEIQAQLASHKAVHEAAVFAKGKGSDQYLVGYYVSDEEVDALILKDYLSESLPDYMVPAYFVWQKEFQLTRNGKINRNALPEPVLEAGEDHITPTNKTEEQLLSIWSEVLKLPQEAISTTANFFELGGHSLRATVVVNKIRKLLEVDVPLKKFFQHSDIRSLASYVIAQNRLGMSNIPKAAEKEHYVLSSAQKRQYFLQQFDPGSVTYNMPQVMKLKGALNLEQLEQAFQSLIDRHESFRTRFEMLDDEPVQIIESEIHFSMEVNEISNHLKAARLVNSFVKPFDLTAAPLLRAAVIKLTEDEHILMTDMHHIIGDGLSMEILSTELMTLYKGETLPALKLQYKDYSEWQQGAEAQKKLENERDFWLEKFEELPEVLSLPTDRARPQTRTFAGDTVHFSIAKGETVLLKQMAQEQGTTMFMLILSLFNLLLSRISNQQDIVVGTPTAGRQHDDLSRIVGMFVNTLPLRNFPAGEKTFSDFLEELKNSTLACFDHQTYQYEELINELQINRDTSRNPLFDVFYAYHNQEESAVVVDDLQSLPYESNGTQTVKFDLSLNAGESNGEIVLSLSYATDLFDRTSIERFTDYFQAITSAITKNPKVKIADIEILSDAEKKVLLYDFNQTMALYPKHKSLIELFELQVEKTPESIALAFGEERLSYLQINDRANQVAHYLQEQKLGTDAKVGVALERSTALIISILGILKAGHAYVPMDPFQPEARLRQILTESKAALLITTAEIGWVLNDTLPCLDINDGEIIAEQIANPWTNASPESLAYVLYTSGSTGKPKGVMVQHRSVVNLIFSQQKSFKLGSEERILQFSTIAFDASAEQIWLALLTGNTLVLVDKETLADTEQFNQYLIDQEVTHLHATPSFLESIELTAYNSLRRIVAGGEVCSPQLAQKFYPQYPFFNKYGPTEATVTTTIYEASEATTSLTKVPIGSPVNNTHAYVLGTAGELLPKGSAGELYLSGDCLAKGYLNDEKQTREKFLANPFQKGKLMYRTGDLVRWLADGNLEFISRIDDQVKVRGYRIELGEIETHMASFELINEVAVLIKGEENDNYLVAYYQSEHEIDNGELKQSLAQKLPGYMVPSYFMRLDTFPYTVSGKLNRKALPEPNIDAIDAYVGPANPTEEALVGIWAEVLKTEPGKINTAANFFEIGGHSLRATVAVNKIRKQLAVEVSLRQFFQYTDIQSLAAFIQTQELLENSSIPKAEVKSHYALSSAQKRQYFLQQFDRDSVAYNMHQVMKLGANVDLDQLQQAFQKMIDRHESFRTRFEMQEEEPVQIIEAEFNFQLRIHTAKNDAEANQLINDFIRPFDLSQASQLRAEVIKVGKSKHMLMTDMHHIISDGLSMEILIGEFQALYGGFDLPALKLQYKDYAEWQQGEKAKAKLSEQRNFWLEKYQDIPEVLNLPIDYRRPVNRSYDGDAVHFTLQNHETEKLEQLAKEQGVTLFMLLLSAFNVLLARLSNQQDIVVGSPTSGRFHDDLAGIVGVFVNTLPLRNEPSGEKTFSTFLQELKESTLSSFDHQSYQYEDLINELQVSRDTSHNPLFDVMFTFQDRETAKATTKDSLNSEVYGHQGADKVKFDLIMAAAIYDNQIAISLNYATELFTKQTVERFASYFKAITQAIIRNADTRLLEIEIIPPAEQSLLLKSFSAAKPAYKCKKTVVDLFVKQAKTRPDATALIYSGQKISYRDLDEKSNRLARKLSNVGIQKGALIALLFDRSPEMIVSMLGVQKSGAAYVPIDPKHPEKRTEYIINDSQASLLIMQAGLDKPKSSIEHWTYDESDLATYSPKSMSVKLSPQDLALVIYTSGTTGKPKGSLIMHQGIPRVVWKSNYLDIKPEDRLLQLSNYAFDGSVFDIYGALTNGASLVLITPEVANDIPAICELIRHEKVTVSLITTALFNLLVSEDTESLKGMRKILFGGEMVSINHVSQALDILGKDRLLHMYGPSESTVYATAYPVNEVGPRSISIPIGKAVSGTALYVLDEYQNLSPIGVTGELYISGRGLSRGYLNNSDLTNERFITNPYAPNERMYKTGDMVRWQADGNLEFQGRADGQIKLRGFRIELAEIESCLMAYESIKEATVIAKGKGSDQYLLGYYAADDDIDQAALKSFLSESLPGYMVPSYLVQLEMLPLTTNGKVDKKALPEPEHGLEGDYKASANETEEHLVAIWSEVLKIAPETISTKADFFELGGHSLRATVVVNKIQKTLQVEVPLKTFFQHSNIQGLAAYVQSQDKLSNTNIPKAAERDHYALSSAQKRQYFLQQFDLGSVAYNIPQVMRLAGPLKLEDLQTAFQGLVDRHESFRTRFVMMEDEPVQIIENDLSFNLEVNEISDLSKATQLVNDFVKPFDLTVAPLLRAAVIRISDEEHILMTDMHHIIGDGVSMEILTTEIMSLYKGDSLPALKLQYKDYSEWQQGAEAQRKLEANRDFWLERFQELPEVLNLPTDRTRPQVRSFAGDTVHFSIPESDTAMLKNIAQEQGSTMFMLVLGLFNMLLSRIANQQDIVIGTPTAGRHHEDLSGIVGMFVNTLPLRNYPTGEKSFSAFLKEVKDATLACFDHQSYQYEELINELQINRDTSRNPLFDVLYAYHNTEESAVAVEELQSLPYENESAQTVKFDLSLNAGESNGAIALSLSYATELFEHSSIERFAQYFQAIASAVAKNAQCKLADVEILPESEKKVLLSDFNQTTALYPKDKSLIELFELQAEKTPGKTALLFGEEQLNYQQINEKANQLAHYLIKQGYADNAKIGVALERSTALIISILGIIKAGHAYVPMDPAQPEARLRQILKESEASLLITTVEMGMVLEETVSCLDINEVEINQEQIDNPVANITPESLAYLLYTSGSTGKPKGVMVQHRSVVNLIYSQQKSFSLSTEERILQFSTIAFDASGEQIWLALLTGNTLVLIDKETLADTEQLNQYLINQEVTHLHATPSFLESIELTGSNSLKRVVAGGEVCSPQLLKEFYPQYPFYNKYGPTEATVTTSIYQASEASLALAKIPIGHPVNNTQAYVLGASGELLPMGSAGELYLSGDCLALGYLNDAQKTQEKFMPNPFQKGTKMYRTGDLVRWLADGNLEFISRVDDQVKVRGYRIELGEIESQLASMESINDVTVLVRGNDHDKYLVAYYQSENEIEDRILKQSLAQKLPDYMVPSYFVRLEAFPYTVSGKLNRKALPAPNIAGANAYVAPENKLEETLVAIWSEVLKTEPEHISTTANFFEIGGHSLRATVAVNKIRKRLAVEVSLRQFFQHTDIQSLATFIQAQERLENSSIPKAAAKDHYVLSSAQKRQYFLQQFDKESTTYNMPQVMRLGVDLDLDRLQSAFQQLVNRHESFRTRFEMQEEEPVQIIEEDFNFELSIHLAHDDLEVKHIINAFVRPFDLAKTSQLRAEVVKLSDGHHVLMTDMHHIISDGLSMQILTREFQALYSGSDLPALNFQYKDFAEWQQSDEAKTKLDNQRSFWLEEYEALPEVLNLPADFRRPANRSYDGAAVHFTLSDNETAGLEKLAREEGVTMFMLLLSAFNVLLSKLSNQQDIVVGSPTSGRFHDDLAGIVGMFVNTLPLRNQPKGDKHFASFLKEVKETTLACFDHQSYQYEDLVNELQVSRDTDHNPLFDVMFTYQDRKESSGASDQSLISEAYEHQGTNKVKFDLIVAARMHGNELSISMNFATELFKPQTIDRFASYFKTITQIIAHNVETKISEIDIISSAERNLLLKKFNATTTANTGKKTVIDLFMKQAKERPDAVALVFSGQHISYRELHEKSNRLANKLRENGIKKGQLIALLFERSPEMIISILGVQKSGAAYLPIDPKYPEKRTEYILSDSKASLLIMQQGISKPKTDIDHWCYSEKELATHSSNTLSAQISPEDLAYVIYTSGTTGKPKGTLIRHQSIPRVVYNTNYLDIRPEDRLLQLSNYSFDGSVFDIYGALTNGASLVLIAPEKAGDIKAICELIKQEKVTLSFITTALFNLLITEDAESLMGLRKILFGGEMVSMSHVSKALDILGKDKLLNVYGPTESTVYTTAYPINEIEASAVSIPIGKPIANTQLYVLDEHLKLSPTGVSGELYISGSGLAEGYLNNPELTKERFIPNPYAPGERMYKTGDLVRWLPDGNLQFQRRADDQIKLRGFRVELAEIENCLMTYESISDVTVLAKGKGADQYLVGYYTAENEIDKPSLKSFLSESLPDYMIPSYFVHLDMLPLTNNGKVDRKALPEPELVNGDAYTAATNETERQLVAIWSAVLKLEPDTISTTADFFELGGHSLRATVVVNKIQKMLEVEVPLKAFFQHSNIQSLAVYVQSQDKLGNTTIPKAEEKEYYALSSAQKRQYFLQQFDQESITYNIPQTIALAESPQPEDLQAAFQGLIDRHESFRTRFVMLDGQPVQVVEKDLNFELEVFEISGNQTLSDITKAFVRPFDLTQAPLIRAGLVRISENEQVLLTDMHHIISDGVSMEILTKEFTSLYNGISLPALRLQYKDYSEWQQGEEAVEKLSKERAFWLKKYETMPEVLELPTDRPRPAERSFAGNSLRIMVDETDTQALKKMAMENGTTMFMLMLSVFNIMLSRLSNQRDIVIGTPTAGRFHDDLSGIVGMFVNTLPLRNNPTGEKTFASFLQEVKSSTLDCFDHQTYQYEELINELKVSRNLSRNPLFDVMYTYRTSEVPSDIEETDATDIHEEDQVASTEKFDLSLTVSEHHEQLYASFSYATDLFDRTTIKRFTSYFKAIISTITEEPTVQLSAIQLMSPGEKHKVLFDFNDTKKPVETELTIDATFEKAMLHRGDKTAITCGSQSLSYHELNESSNQLARALLKHKNQEESMVGIMVPRSNELMISIMGVLKAGCAYVPIDPDYPIDRIKYIIEDSGLEVLLTEQSLMPITDELDDGIRLLDVHSSALATEPKANLERIATPASLAYMIYTSGSTGKPKGVMIAHDNVINFVQGVTDRISFAEESKVLCLTTVSFDIFVLEALLPLLKGLEVVLSSATEQKDIKSIKSLIKDKQVDMVQMTPSHLKLLLSEDQNADTLHSVKTLMLGGEVLPIELLHQLKRGFEGKIYNMYGPTETTVWSTICELTHVDSIEIGSPIANTFIRILDPDHNLAPIGTVGELCIGGRGVARGYWQKEQLTEARFITDPFDQNQRIYKTGDLARWLPNGNIQCLGRLDDQVKIRGHRIELGEVESQLLQHAQVLEAAVVVHEQNGDKFLAAYYKAENEVSITDLRDFLMAGLPDYMVPSYYESIDEIPLTPNGKVNRKALREREMTVRNNYVAPSNDVEQRLVEIWSTVLQIDAEIIGVTSVFFELGGHSLNAMAVINSILSEFDVAYPLRELFRQPTIKAIAEYVQTRLWLDEQSEDEDTTEVTI